MSRPIRWDDNTISPKRKETAPFKTDVTTREVHAQSAVYARVSRSRAFPISQPGRALHREMAKIERKLSHERHVLTHYEAHPTVFTLPRRHLQRSRVIHAENRLQTLKGIEARYIRENIYEYIPRTPEQDFLYVE